MENPKQTNRVVEDDLVLVDPAIHLNDELMFLIFSFVGGKTMSETGNRQVSANPQKRKASDSVAAVEEEEEEVSMDSLVAAVAADRLACSQSWPKESFLSVKEAGQFYRSLALVSVGWKRVLDESIRKLVAIPLNADFIVLSNARDCHTECMLWLCQHRLSIGRINAAMGIDPTFGALIQQCDTSQLVSLNFCLAFLCTEAVRHVALEAGVDEVTDKLRVHKAFIGYYDRLRKTQDLIAKECPSLQSLAINLVWDISVDGGMVLTNGISSELFSLDTVAEMKVGLHFFEAGGRGIGCAGQAPNANLLLSNIIKKNPRLRSLSMSCPNPSWQGTIQVESASLRHLTLDKFTQDAKVSLKCPSLRSFAFHGPEPPEARSGSHQKVVQAESLPPDCIGISRTALGSQLFWRGRLAHIFGL